MKLLAAAAVGFVAGAIVSGLLAGWLRIAPCLVDREHADVELHLVPDLDDEPGGGWQS